MPPPSWHLCASRGFRVRYGRHLLRVTVCQSKNVAYSTVNQDVISTYKPLYMAAITPSRKISFPQETAALFRRHFWPLSSNQSRYVQRNSFTLSVLVDTRIGGSEGDAFRFVSSNLPTVIAGRDYDECNAGQRRMRIGRMVSPCLIRRPC